MIKANQQAHDRGYILCRAMLIGYLREKNCVRRCKDTIFSSFRKASKKQTALGCQYNSIIHLF